MLRIYLQPPYVQECLDAYRYQCLLTLHIGVRLYNKKSVRAVLVARSACRGLRIAHHCRTSKPAEASRGICAYTPTADAHAPCCRRNIHIHRHLLFAAFLTVIESCEVSTSQERASSKRFLIMSAVPPALP